MSFLKSKLGWSCVGIYFLIVLYGLAEALLTPPSPMKGFALLILGLPGSYLLSGLLVGIGVIDDKTAPSWFLFVFVFGVACNIAILYLFGYSVSMLIGLFRTKSRR